MSADNEPAMASPLSLPLQPVHSVGGQPSKKPRLSVPDEESRARLECILREQLDLELYLKQKEISTITGRLHQSQALLDVLESAIRSQQCASSIQQDVSDGYSSYFRNLADSLDFRQGTVPQRSSAGASHRQRPRRAAANSKCVTDGSGTLYAQRADGEIVRMVCANCQRDEFISLQAFLNHCRIHHTVEFSSPDEAISICGIAVDDGGGNASHPTNKSSLQSGQGKASTHGPRVSALADKLSAEQMSSVADALEFLNMPRISEQESSDANSESDSQSDVYTKRHAKSSTAKSRSSGPAAPIVRALDSRFHVIRRVMLGNTSQYIDPTARPPGQESCTHKWTVFLRSVSSAHPEGEYIRRVRVFLHPSYRPDDIVDLSPPKFELTRWGWGEFPVRLQVFFNDKRNKPVDLIHMLKLDESCSGECALGAEAPIDFEIDRRGLSKDSQSSDQQPTRPLPPSLPPPPANSLLKQLFTELCRLYPLLLTDAVPRSLDAPSEPEKILDLVAPAVTERWTWCVAISADVWENTWPLGKQLAAEAHRNRKLLSLIFSATRSLASRSEGAAEPTKALADTTASILRAAGASDSVVKSLESSVQAAGPDCCKECLDILYLWLHEYPAVTLRKDRVGIRADTARSLQNKSYAWSLKRWLRFNGFSPQQAPQVSEYGYGQDPGLQPATRGNPRAPRFRFFCHSCGALLSRKDPRFTIANGKPAKHSSVALPAITYCNSNCESIGRQSYSTATRVSDALAQLPQGWDASDEEEDDDTLLMIDDDANAYSTAATPLASRQGSPGAKDRSAGYGKIQKLAETLREYHMKQQSKLELVHNSDDENCGNDGSGYGDSVSDKPDNEDQSKESGGPLDDIGIDWVWSTVRQLELNGAPASRLSVASTNMRADSSDKLVQLPNSSDEALGEALDQRLVVGRLLFDVAKLFLRDLVLESDQVMRKNRADVLAKGLESDEQADAGSVKRLLILTPLHVLGAAKRNPQLFDVCSNAYLAEGAAGPTADHRKIA